MINGKPRLEVYSTSENIGGLGGEWTVLVVRSNIPTLYYTEIAFARNGQPGISTGTPIMFIRMYDNGYGYSWVRVK